MTLSQLTAISIATLPVGSRFGDQGALVERTAVGDWRFRSGDHDVALRRGNRTWLIEDHDVPVGTTSHLFDAVNLAFGVL